MGAHKGHVSFFFHRNLYLQLTIGVLLSCGRKVEVAIEETHVPLMRHRNSLTVDKHNFRSIRCFPSIITIGKCHSLVDLLFWNTENI